MDDIIEPAGARRMTIGGDLAALHLAPAGSTDGPFSRRYPTAIAKGRELGLQLSSFAAQHRANIVTQLQKSLN
jgi:hypothetical protein